ncbi:hypothetical protein HY311_03685 [Candidatus Nomurabacteria bacterium]|nr:hypothetical protein [Candidatus Nomurabacteria bacterium]
MQNQKKFLMSLAILLAVFFVATQVLADLTFTNNSISGTTASLLDVGAGNTLSLQTTNNGPVTFGNGAITIGNLAGGGIKCLHVSNTGVVSVAAADCGAGGTTTLQFSFMLGADGGIALTDGIAQNTIFSNQLGRGIHITKVWCETDAGTPTLNMKKRGAGSNLLSSNLTCTTSGASGTTFSSTQDAYADGDIMDFTLATATTARRITVVVRYTLD